MHVLISAHKQDFDCNCLYEVNSFQNHKEKEV